MAAKETPPAAPEVLSKAIVPEPEQHTEHEYLVTGPHEVHGYASGETFTMLIPADQEALLIESGSLARHDQTTTKEGE